MRIELIYFVASIRKTKQDTGLQVSLFSFILHSFSAPLGVSDLQPFRFHFLLKIILLASMVEGKRGQKQYEVQRRLRDPTFHSKPPMNLSVFRSDA